MRQKILWLMPFPSALSGPFAAPLFAPLSAMRNSLWMRLQFYFRLNGFIIKLCSLYTICAGLSSVIFRQTKTNVPGIKTLFVWEGFNPPLHCRVKPMEPANSDVILSGMKWSRRIFAPSMPQSSHMVRRSFDSFHSLRMTLLPVVPGLTA